MIEIFIQGPRPIQFEQLALYMWLLSGKELCATPADLIITQ